MGEQRLRLGSMRRDHAAREGGGGLTQEDGSDEGREELGNGKDGNADERIGVGDERHTRQMDQGRWTGVKGVQGERSELCMRYVGNSIKKAVSSGRRGTGESSEE